MISEDFDISYSSGEPIEINNTPGVSICDLQMWLLTDGELEIPEDFTAKDKLTVMDAISYEESQFEPSERVKRFLKEKFNLSLDE